MPPTISRMFAALFLCVGLYCPNAAANTQPTRECVVDLDCLEDERCDGFFCLPAEEICTSSLPTENSAGCAEGQVCDFTNNSCPTDCGDACPERCMVPNGYCVDLNSSTCEKDQDCEGDQLCVVENTPTCSSEDEFCLRLADPACDPADRICAPACSTSIVDFCEVDAHCFGGEVCNIHGRCVAPSYLEVSNLIEPDETRAPIKSSAPGDTEIQSAGCSVGLLGRDDHLPVWLTLGALLGVVYRRRSIG